MGRNAASQIIWTLEHDGTNYISTWYCQQHAVWKQKGNSTGLSNTTQKLDEHFENIHGVIKQ